MFIFSSRNFHSRHKRHKNQYQKP